MDLTGSRDPGVWESIGDSIDLPALRIFGRVWAFYAERASIAIYIHGALCGYLDRVICVFGTKEEKASFNLIGMKKYSFR